MLGTILARVDIKHDAEQLSDNLCRNGITSHFKRHGLAGDPLATPPLPKSTDPWCSGLLSVFRFCTRHRESGEQSGISCEFRNALKSSKSYLLEYLDPLFEGVIPCMTRDSFALCCLHSFSHVCCFARGDTAQESPLY